MPSQPCSTPSQDSMSAFCPNLVFLPLFWTLVLLFSVCKTLVRFPAVPVGSNTSTLPLFQTYSILLPNFTGYTLSRSNDCNMLWDILSICNYLVLHNFRGSSNMRTIDSPFIPPCSNRVSLHPSFITYISSIISSPPQGYNRDYQLNLSHAEPRQCNPHPSFPFLYTWALRSAWSSVWLTGETEYTIQATLRTQPILLLWLSAIDNCAIGRIQNSHLPKTGRHFSVALLEGSAFLSLWVNLTNYSCDIFTGPINNNLAKIHFFLFSEAWVYFASLITWLIAFIFMTLYSLFWSRFRFRFHAGISVN